MPEMTIIVEFETLDGREAEFAALMREHARRTLHEERGCLRFEVIKPVEADSTPIPNRLVVNELYTDATALAEHQNNPRMERLRAAADPLIKSRRRILARALDEEVEDAGLAPDELNASNDD